MVTVWRGTRGRETRKKRGGGVRGAGEEGREEGEMGKIAQHSVIFRNRKKRKEAGANKKRHGNRD